MRLLTIFNILATILHTASALPNTTSPLFNLSLLPNCAHSCRALLKAATNCLPPTAPVSNHATYIDCFCKNEWLRSLNDVGEMCSQSCDKKDEAVIERTYGSLCGVPSPYVTLSSTASPTGTATTTSSLDTASTTSTSALVPAHTSAPTIEGPQLEHKSSESWAHSHWTSIVEGSLIPLAVLFFVAAVAALYAWYTRIRARRRDRPMSEEERRQYAEQLLEERLRDQGYIQLQAVNNKSLRERLGLSRSKAPARDPISDRRPHRRDLSISTSTTAPLVKPPPGSEQATWTPRRPASARTAASSIGHRSVSSPLSPFPQLAPPLPIIPSTPRKPPTMRTPSTPGAPIAPRSVSSPFLPTTPRSDHPHLPPISSMPLRSHTAHSLAFYREEQARYQK